MPPKTKQTSWTPVKSLEARLQEKKQEVVAAAAPGSEAEALLADAIAKEKRRAAAEKRWDRYWNDRYAMVFSPTQTEVTSTEAGAEAGAGAGAEAHEEDPKAWLKGCS